MKLSMIILAGLVAVSGCSEVPDDGLYGYVEGDFISMAPDTPGRVMAVLAGEGDRVVTGAALVQMDAVLEHAAVDASRARLEAAHARFDDAAAGARAPEIGAARDQLAQARAAQTEAIDGLNRTRDLFEQEHVSQARLDQAQAVADAANARVAEMRQRLSLVQLPAREHQLRALQAEVAAIQAELNQAEYRLSRRTLTVPFDARIHRQIRFVGELAGPGLPVVSLLPDGAVHAVFFIPEDELAGLPVGTPLSVSCDNCPSGLSALITTIDDEAEFTPPIIYSDKERARLVYRAEARFVGGDPSPGIPIKLERTSE